MIGSKVGGVTKQVLHGENGFLVAPRDTDAIASGMARLLDHPDEAEALGKKAREHVRKNFLLPRLVARYLHLLRYYSGVTRKIPEFRLDSVAYSDIAHALRPGHPRISTPLVNGNWRRLWVDREEAPRPRPSLRPDERA